MNAAAPPSTTTSIPALAMVSVWPTVSPLKIARRAPGATLAGIAYMKLPIVTVPPVGGCVVGAGPGRWVGFEVGFVVGLLLVGGALTRGVVGLVLGVPALVVTGRVGDGLLEVVTGAVVTVVRVGAAGVVTAVAGAAWVAVGSLGCSAVLPGVVGPRAAVVKEAERNAEAAADRWAEVTGAALSEADGVPGAVALSDPPEPPSGANAPECAAACRDAATMSGHASSITSSAGSAIQVRRMTDCVGSHRGRLQRGGRSTTCRSPAEPPSSWSGPRPGQPAQSGCRERG